MGIRSVEAVHSPVTKQRDADAPDSLEQRNARDNRPDFIAAAGPPLMILLAYRAAACSVRNAALKLRAVDSSVGASPCRRTESTSAGPALSQPHLFIRSSGIGSPQPDTERARTPANPCFAR